MQRSYLSARKTWSDSDSDEFDGRQYGLPGAAAGQAGAAGLGVAIQLDPELLNMLYRRSRRRLRDIRAMCHAGLKLDRVRSTLHVTGTPEAIEAVRSQLEHLGGPVKSLSAAVWMELLRTRTLTSGPQATIVRMQEASGCRIHIERGRQEVRLFGPKDQVVVAAELLDKFAESCVDEAVPVADPTVFPAMVLQAIAHAFSVTLRVEDKEIRALGIRESVAKAVGELQKYLRGPESYDVGSLPQAPQCEEELPEQDTADRATVAAPAPRAAQGVPQRPPAAAQHNSKNKRGAAGRGDDAQKAQGGSGQTCAGGCCSCCGAARFCTGCGAPVWQWTPSQMMMQPWPMGGYPQQGVPYQHDAEGKSRAGVGPQKWAATQSSYMFPMDPKASGDGHACAVPVQSPQRLDSKVDGSGQAAGAHMQPMMQAYMLPANMIPAWCGL